MTQKTLAQVLITKQTVLAANARVIALSRGETAPPVKQSAEVAAKVRDIASSSRHAFQELKKT